MVWGWAGAHLGDDEAVARVAHPSFSGCVKVEGRATCSRPSHLSILVWSGGIQPPRVTIG
jgi:hypothetical protein